MALVGEDAVDVMTSTGLVKALQPDIQSNICNERLLAHRGLLRTPAGGPVTPRGMVYW